MIEDTLKANPGMRETYRQYSVAMNWEAKIGRLEADLDQLRGMNGCSEKVEKTEEQLERLRNNLSDTICKIRECYENEETLRTQGGYPPLEPKVLRAAEESLAKFERIASRKCSVDCA